MFGKKRLAKKMIQGVDTVRLVLYKVLVDDFSEKYEEEEYLKMLWEGVYLLKVATIRNLIHF